VWAFFFFISIFIPVKIIYKEKLKKGRTYVFCSNHFSFLDILTIGLNSIPKVFVGKSSLGKVPLFGYMYRKIHITVDRHNLKSRYEVIDRSFAALEQGLSLVIFPEGGINSQQPPQMATFKDGPFRIAIEKKIPIVPVAVPFNWKILPDDGKYLLNWHRELIVFHKPIDTSKYTMDQLDELKKNVFEIIQKELNHQNRIV
jgi:1-acyl-sn-glycerol-3-phosphate acyltransferase